MSRNSQRWKGLALGSPETASCPSRSPAQHTGHWITFCPSSLSQEHKSLHIVVRCSPKALNSRDKDHDPATAPRASFRQPHLLQFALCSPAEATSRKCWKLRKFTATLKSVLKRKKKEEKNTCHAFLCEINLDTEMSEGENGSLNRSLQQGENGGKRIDF